MTDLVIANGTVATPEGTVAADVAVADGRIERIGPDLDADGVEVIDATGLLVLPGVIDVHTHLRLPDAEHPHRFSQDTLAAAAGGTTTVLTFNNPGTGISEDGARSPLRGLHEFQARTAGESAVDFGLSAVISGQQDDPIAELPALIDAGVPTFKAFMVYDFRLADADLDRALRDGRAARRDAPGPLRGAGDHRSAGGRRIGPRGDRVPLPRAHAALACRGGGDAEGDRDGPPWPRLRSTSSISHARRRSRPSQSAKARGEPVYAETCPHYLTFTDALYADPDEAEVIKRVISPPLRTAADVDELWAGLREGILDVVGSDHVPDRIDTEKALPAPPFPEISNGGPGVETLLSVVFSEGVARGRLSRPAHDRGAGRDAGAPLRTRIEGCGCGGSGCGSRPVGPERAQDAAAG